ncbi:hypothetical protein GGR58DRAFT_244926 [Xylaria digitata]|nr:hypothetical protein GGR58DRAFT_244926 [Xylaria digitata]
MTLPRVFLSLSVLVAYSDILNATLVGIRLSCLPGLPCQGMCRRSRSPLSTPGVSSAALIDIPSMITGSRPAEAVAPTLYERLYPLRMITYATLYNLFPRLTSSLRYMRAVFGHLGNAGHREPMRVYSPS